MLPEPNDILSSPHYHCLGMSHDRAAFCRMDRDHYRRSIFLDRRVNARDARPIDVPLEPLLAAMDEGRTMPARWIFHIAHCGSTLLSRLLDHPGHCLSLREPPALRQLGIERADRLPPSLLKRRAALARALAARRFEEPEMALIKANVPVNFILDLLDEMAPSEPAIALYLSWEDYLLAILRTENHRGWVERITGIFRAEVEEQATIPMGSSVAEKAAALWLAQMDRFSSMLNGNSRAIGLDAEVFFANPLAVASAAANHLALEGIDVAINAGLVDSYSKEPTRPFDSRIRRERADTDRARLSDELRAAGAWLDRVARQRGIPTQLERRLTAG